jgi:hypothetical protein
MSYRVLGLCGWRWVTKLVKCPLMITAFIIANNDAKALTRTLNALIGATVDGLVREVIVLAESTNEMAAKLADDAGCELIGGPAFSAAIHAAKGDWLLVFQGGALPEQGWAEAIENHIQSGHGAARFTRSPLSKRKFTQRFFQNEQPLALGLLIEKRAALTLKDVALSSPENLAKAASPKPLSAALRPA